MRATCRAEIDQCIAISAIGVVELWHVSVCTITVTSIGAA